MKAERIIRLFLVVLVLFFVVAGEAPGEGEWTPDNVEIVPENPTSADVVDITFSGNWPDSCIPTGSNVRVDGSDIYFEVFEDTSDACWAVITPWEQTQSVGPLSPGRYTVYAALVNPMEAVIPQYTQVAQFNVAETNTYVFVPGQSTLVKTGGPVWVHETYTIEGWFQLTFDIDANTASFDEVYGDLYHNGVPLDTTLDILLRMTEMISTSVSDTLIVFESNSLPGGITGELTLTFEENDSVHLTGIFVEPYPDGFQFDLDAIARKKIISNEVSWISGESGPADWKVEPNYASTSDIIHFFGPTAIFGNSCSATVSVGGTPTLTIDPVNKTIELWFQPPPPYICPLVYAPVCGLEGSFGPLEAGQWLFFGNDPNATFSIPFQVNSTIDSNSIVDNGIKYYMRTDKSVYKLDEQVEMLYRVTNLTPNSVDIGYILNCEDAWTHFAITDDGDTDIWQFFRIIPPCGYIMFSLDPYESRECQMVWDMTNDNGTYEPDDDFHVGSGLYNIAGELELEGGYQRVPVSVTIEIIPFVYVDADATGADDGSCWADAYTSLPYALDVVLSGYGIRVAQGTYRPNDGVVGIGDERELTFQLKNGVTVKGGYAGYGEPDPNDWDIDAYETILSGDLLGNDVGDLDDPSRDDNSYHVATGSGTDATAVLDGFTITGGNAPYGGGGMYNYEGDPTVINCTFISNSAEYFGGGMYNYKSSPTVTNCTFSSNSGGGGGGGMTNVENSSPTVTNCIFSENSAPGVLISGGGGGGVYNDTSSPIVTNCIFSRNTAAAAGGGISNWWGANPTIHNCTFSSNSAADAGGICNYVDCSPTVTNCILWGDTPNEMCADIGTPVVTYSDVKDGWIGLGNINVDPLFVDANGPDGIAGTEDDNLRLSADSPCIDAGNNSAVTVSTDLDGNPRIINGIVDMGAYEFYVLIIYVDADATGAGDGSSWADAFPFLQHALSEATYYVNHYGLPAEIRVAQGTYKPHEGVLYAPELEREQTFQLINGVTIKGGYAGYNEPDSNARDIETYETILSGDLNGDDAEITDPADLIEDISRGDNSYHVVTGSGTNATAVLDGFTITRGNFNLYPDCQLCCGGAGLLNENGSPTVSNCKFTKNAAAASGGGMCSFVGDPKVTNCIFFGNWAEFGGGGMSSGNGEANITNCVFIGNSAYVGGALLAFGDNFNPGAPTIINTTFSGNNASQGGAIFCEELGGPIIVNSILYGDSATTGPEIAMSSIEWGSGLSISYSDVQGGESGVAYDPENCQLDWGMGNIDVDPRFVDPCDGDYHLKSEGWRWDKHQTHGPWKYDLVTSRCIDAGNPGSPLADELLTIPNDPNHDWGVNLRINMGAYGGTAQASMPPYDWTLLGDLSNDGTVDYEDLAGQVEDWLTIANEQPGDLNRDGIVNMADFALLAQDWLQMTDWANRPPEVYITNPPDGFEFFWLTESVFIAADAWDVDGSVVKVEFFVNGNKWGEDDDGTNGWKMVASFDVGTYILAAKATDDDGTTTTSPPVTITAVEE